MPHGAATPPCAWVQRGGYTFRWRRGDEVMTVQRGNHSRRHDIADMVDQVPVLGEWQDLEDVRRQADQWLARQPRQAAPNRPR